MKPDVKNFTTPSNRKLEIRTFSSKYHIELTPSEVGVHDRIVVQEVVKEMAQTAQIDQNAQKQFKVVILCEADNLSREAQHGLRRTMEKYAQNCRIILCCESLSRIIEPLQSRCILVNVPAPSNLEVAQTIKYVCAEERVKIPESVLQQLVEKSDNNMRRALLMLEASVSENENEVIPSNYTVPVPEWETYLKDTADLILKKQSSDQLHKVRENLYELLSRCIPPTLIFKKLVELLLPSCDESIIGEVVSEACNFENRMVLGQKPIFHLEAFVAAFMEIYLDSKSKK